MRPLSAVGDRRAVGFADAGRRIVEFALRAPSVHNTQPWRWRIGPERLDLYADRDRQLPMADPLGRNLTVSCGAALEYAVVGASAEGWASTVEVLPEPRTADHLATLRLSPAPVTREAASDASLLGSRRTDRRRLIPWPVPEPLLEGLAAHAALGSASVTVVASLSARLSVELLVSRAMSVERLDGFLVEEQGRWVNDGLEDGIPHENAQPADDGLHALAPSRYSAPSADDDSQLVTAPLDGLLVIVAEEDAPRGWVDAGRVLCRVWAAAMDHGLSVVPLSQVIEVGETRRALRTGVLGTDAHPQLLLRLGWQELARSPLPPTPRRDLDDVLLP